jgi:uncharacterized protein YdaU (DUF1376 family)
VEQPEKKDRYGAFLLYVDDWLSSTAIDLMSAAEERGYLRLLMHAWKSPDCGLPNDSPALAKLSKLGGGWQGKSGDVLRAQFFERDGRLFNDRLLRERQHQQAVRESRSNAGRTAAVYRWNASRITDAQQKHANPNPSPNSIETHKESALTEQFKRVPLTEETSADDRAYVDAYMDRFCATNGVYPEPWECPFRCMNWQKDPSNPLLTVSIEFGEWVLGPMPFDRPSTWGMVHFVPQPEVDRMNAPFNPRTAPPETSA